SQHERFTKLQGAELGAGNALIHARERQRPLRFVNGFGRQLKRAEVHTQALLRAEVEVGLYRLSRVHVDVLHEPARLVRADGQKGQVDRAEAPTDFVKHRTIPGVSGKVHAPLSDIDGKPSPQRVIAIERMAG